MFYQSIIYLGKEPSRTLLIQNQLQQDKDILHWLEEYKVCVWFSPPFLHIYLHILQTLPMVPIQSLLYRVLKLLDITN